MELLRRETSRRQFLGALAAAGGAALFGLGALPGIRRVAEAHPQGGDLRHLAWVWQFSQDGAPEAIRPVLAAHNLGITLKTHDGTDWMAKYDSSRYAVTGPTQVRGLADYFERGGVAFHAWCVVSGLEPRREAELAAAVLGAGARSIILDVEAGRGFWRGTGADAALLGQELRRLQPGGRVYVSVDPRPWRAELVPLAEFAVFSDGFMPQAYWETFNSPGNVSRFEQSGWPTGSAGVTPELLLEVSRSVLKPYGLPIQPIGQGSASGDGAWQRFVDRAFQLGMGAVGVWRYGVTGSDVWQLLKKASPQGTGEVYVVQPGDTLSALARRWGVSVGAILALNGLSDPNYIRVGQRLRIPGRGS